MDHGSEGFGLSSGPKPLLRKEWSSPVSGGSKQLPSGPIDVAPARPSVPLVRLREVWSILRPHRPRLLLALVFGLLSIVLTLSQPALATLAINGVIKGEPALQYVLYLVALLLADAIVAGTQSFVLQRSGDSLVLELRTSLIQRLVCMHMREYDQQRIGDLLSRVSNDTSQAHAFVANGVVSILLGLISLAGAAALMLIMDPVLCLATFACVGLSTVAVLRLAAGLRRSTEHVQTGVGVLTSELERVIGMLRTVRAQRAEAREIQRLTRSAVDIYDAGRRAARMDALMAPLVAVTANGSFLLVLGVGGARVAAGQLTIGDFVGFL
jgi:ABC-type multidrug transport system fused ATPase/permease subunit